MSEEDLSEAADELDQHGWVHLSQTLGMGKANFSDLWPTPLLFIETDPIVKGCDPRTDAKTLAATMMNAGADGVSLAEMDKALGWGPRRLNPAACYLSLNDYAKASQVCGSHPYAFEHMFITPRTRRFAKEGDLS